MKARCIVVLSNEERDRIELIVRGALEPYLDDGVKLEAVAPFEVAVEVDFYLRRPEELDDREHATRPK